MSVDSVNLNNINKIRINTPKNTANSTEQKKNGNMLLLGSLAALALISGGIYLATRGHNSKAIKTVANETANNTGNLIKRGITPELIEDTEIRNIIKDINTNSFTDCSTASDVYFYSNKLKSTFFKKLLERFVNCKSPSELCKAVDELSAKKYNIPEKAVGEVENNIDLKHLIEATNKEGRVKIAIEEDSTPQKKVATFLSASLEDQKIRLLDQYIYSNIRTSSGRHLTQVEKKDRIEETYEYIMKELKLTWDFLNG